VGGAIEVDRSVLERMVGPFEHLLRNSVAHGIESPQSRAGVGKEATGSITMSVTQEGNEVASKCATMAAAWTWAHPQACAGTWHPGRGSAGQRRRAGQHDLHAGFQHGQ
jgi:hypothetical protein